MRLACWLLINKLCITGSIGVGHIQQLQFWDIITDKQHCSINRHRRLIRRDILLIVQNNGIECVQADVVGIGTINIILQ